MRKQLFQKLVHSFSSVVRGNPVSPRNRVSVTARPGSTCELAVEQLEARTLPAPLLNLVSTDESLLPRSSSAGDVAEAAISAERPIPRLKAMNPAPGRFAMPRAPYLRYVKRL